DAKDIRESLWILLSTSLGERIMVPTYGCMLWQMVFRNLTPTLLTELKDMVEQAIVNWEPRVTVEAVEVHTDTSVAGWSRSISRTRSGPPTRAATWSIPFITSKRPSRRRRHKHGIASHSDGDQRRSEPAEPLAEGVR